MPSQRTESTQVSSASMKNVFAANSKPLHENICALLVQVPCKNATDDFFRRHALGSSPVGKLLCLFINLRTHLAELGSLLAEQPNCFVKFCDFLATHQILLAVTRAAISPAYQPGSGTQVRRSAADVHTRDVPNGHLPI
eukprot:361814-Chlamydomonas_euryale.AAC.6